MLEKQTAGNNSTQVQANIVNIIGIDEKRVREIVDEKIEIAIREYSSEGQAVVVSRGGQLKQRLVPRMAQQKNGLTPFADPGFQIALTDALKVAGASERDSDFDLLTELLVHRANDDGKLYTRTGIRHAIQIVNEVSEEALLGLTIVHAIGDLVRISTDVQDFLIKTNEQFGRILMSPLPAGKKWIEQLYILNAVRIENRNHFLSIEKIYSSQIDGIITPGIVKNSDLHRQAISILKANGLPVDLLVDNDLKPGYVRLNVCAVEALRSLFGRKYTLSQIDALTRIFSLNSRDEALLTDVRASFAERWKQYPYLEKIYDWWSELPVAFELTSVGKVLAQANAKMYDNNVPQYEVE